MASNYSIFILFFAATCASGCGLFRSTDLGAVEADMGAAFDLGETVDMTEAVDTASVNDARAEPDLPDPCETQCQSGVCEDGICECDEGYAARWCDECDEGYLLSMLSDECILDPCLEACAPSLVPAECELDQAQQPVCTCPTETFQYDETDGCVEICLDEDGDGRGDGTCEETDCNDMSATVWMEDQFVLTDVDVRRTFRDECLTGGVAAFETQAAEAMELSVNYAIAGDGGGTALVAAFHSEDTGYIPFGCEQIDAVPSCADGGVGGCAVFNGRAPALNQTYDLVVQRHDGSTCAEATDTLLASLDESPTGEIVGQYTVGAGIGCAPGPTAILDINSSALGRTQRSYSTTEQTFSSSMDFSVSRANGCLNCFVGLILAIDGEAHSCLRHNLAPTCGGGYWGGGTALWMTLPANATGYKRVTVTPIAGTDCADSLANFPGIFDEMGIARHTIGIIEIPPPPP